MGHALSENRYGLVFGVGATRAISTAERAALGLVGELAAAHDRRT